MYQSKVENLSFIWSLVHAFNLHSVIHPSNQPTVHPSIETIQPILRGQQIEWKLH